eukprot:COSAG02_NODE_3587_length_6520_cov_6.037060_4_plen_272_part_00
MPGRASGLPQLSCAPRGSGSLPARAGCTEHERAEPVWLTHKQRHSTDASAGRSVLGARVAAGGGPRRHRLRVHLADSQRARLRTATPCWILFFWFCPTTMCVQLYTLLLFPRSSSTFPPCRYTCLSICGASSGGGPTLTDFAFLRADPALLREKENACGSVQQPTRILASWVPVESEGTLPRLDGSNRRRRRSTAEACPHRRRPGVRPSQNCTCVADRVGFSHYLYFVVISGRYVPNVVISRNLSRPRDLNNNKYILNLNLVISGRYFSPF